MKEQLQNGPHAHLCLSAEKRLLTAFGAKRWDIGSLLSRAAVFVSGTLLLLGIAGCKSPMQADAEDLARFPIRSDLAGSPPESGSRYWSEFKVLPYHTKALGSSYISVIHPPQGGVEFWGNTWGERGSADRTCFVRKGPSIFRMGPEEPVFDGTLINDIFSLDTPSALAPGRGISRPSVILDPEEGYVLFCGVCPEYLPGQVPMLPALFVSKSGAKGTWKYLGTLKGEPAEEVKRTFAESKQHVWINGGGLVRLPDRRWRVYINGFDRKLSAAESETLQGPWRFLRNEKGQIRELLPDCPVGAIFPHLLKVGSEEWHLWATDTWPPQSIWHYRSDDGIAWRAFGLQPEITRKAVGNLPIKCLRSYVDPKSGRLVGLLSVWRSKPGGGKGWHISLGYFDDGPEPTIANGK